MTNKELVSRIVNGLRLLNKDEHISRRYVLHVAKNKAKFLISQKLNDKSLFKEDNVYKTLNCLKLKKDDIIKCDVVEFRRCKSLMKSVKKLPEMVYSKYGNSIISVTTIDGETEFLPIILKQFSLLKNRPYAKYVKNNYYYVRDGYLYIPDSEVEFVDVIFIPMSEKEVDEASDCRECDKCKSSWDYEFICPDKLLEPVIQDTLQEVTNTFRKIAIDENPNLDSNQKSQTTQ